MSCFPGLLFRYFPIDFEVVSISPVINGYHPCFYIPNNYNNNLTLMGNVLQAYLLNIPDYCHYTRMPIYTSDIIFCCREKCTLHYKTALLLLTLTPSSFRSFFVISYFLQTPYSTVFLFLFCSQGWSFIEFEGQKMRVSTSTNRSPLLCSLFEILSQDLRDREINRA